MAQFQVVIPSRNRPSNWSRLGKLLPDALLCVDERERDAYSAVVPAGNLWFHPPTSTIGQVRAWIIANATWPCIVMVDDDFRGVRPLVGDKRAKIVEPAAISRIITNGMQVALDLGLSGFGWNRNPNPVMFQPFRPIGFCGPLCGAFGVIGKRFTFDTQLIHGEDCDFTLRLLLEERIVFCDNRYYFDFGAVGSGAGGQQGLRTDDRIQKDIELLERRWGSHLSLSGRAGSQNWRGRSVKTGMKIRVSRKNPLVTS